MKKIWGLLIIMITVLIITTPSAMAYQETSIGFDEIRGEIKTVVYHTESVLNGSTEIIFQDGSWLFGGLYTGFIPRGKPVIIKFAGSKNETPRIVSVVIAEK